MYKRLFCLLCLMFLFFGGLIAQTGLIRYAEKLKKNACFDNSVLSFKVMDLSSGDVITEYNSSISVVPASVMKIVTTGVALEVLGVDYQFFTSLLYSGIIDSSGVLKGNLYISGGADPLFCSFYDKRNSVESIFKSWADVLLGKGINSIDGDLIIDNSLFVDSSVNGKWLWEDIGNYFGAGVWSLNFNENLYELYINAGNNVGDSACFVKVLPESCNVKNINRVKTSYKDSIYIYGTPYNCNRLVEGTVKYGSSNLKVKGSLPDPGLCCGLEFSKYIFNKGIVLNGRVQNGSVAENCLLLAEHKNSIIDVMKYANVNSNNICADALFKMLGMVSGYGSSFVGGRSCMLNFFGKNGFELDGLNFTDGSGLARTNLLSADFLCQYLMMMYGSSYYEEFMSSLPIVGKTGTVRNILIGTDAEGVIKCKSGTMQMVKSYAGYAVRNGRPVCFSIVVNNFSCDSSKVLYALHTFLRLIDK